MNFLLGALVGISGREWTDPRNEYAIATARRIRELLESGELQHQPFI